MFGIIRPCRNRLSESLRAAWWAHLCGLCLALRDDHGQLARVATNYDGLIVSALVEAQAPVGTDGRRTAGPCPLRGHLRRTDVAHGASARLAATVSLVLASAKVGDHIQDRDGAFRRRGVRVAARRIAGRWAEQGERVGAELGLDTAVLVRAIDRQAELEAAAGPGSSLLTVTEPTELATAAAIAHTAVLAGRPANADALAEIGRLFGRVAHLLDAVEDQPADDAAGAWNPLTATETGLDEARRLCDDAVLGIKLALAEVEFTDGRLVHALLGKELEHSVRRTFKHRTQSNYPGGYPPPPPGEGQPGPYPQQPGYPPPPPPGYPQQPGQYPPPGYPQQPGYPPQPGPYPPQPGGQYDPNRNPDGSWKSHASQYQVERHMRGGFWSSCFGSCCGTACADCSCCGCECCAEGCCSCCD